MLAPRVTVGLPVYNGEHTLPVALECLLAQDYPQLAILVSDNASTDATADICRRYAARHANIAIVRQPATVRVMENYRLALMAAKTEYFMWLGSDDVVAPQFISRHVGFLDQNPGYVSSQSKVLFHNACIPARLSRGTFALRESPAANLGAFLHTPQDNSRFYGLFRTKALQESYPADDFLGLDWAIMALTLRHGRQNEIDDVLMLRDATPPQKYQSGFDAEHSSWRDRTFPLARFTRFMLRNHSDAKRLRPLYELCRLNWQMTRDYVSYRAFLKATSRLAEKRPALSPAAVLDSLVAAWTNPEPGPSAADQWHTMRTSFSGLFASRSASPPPVRFRDEQWRALPRPASGIAETTVVLVVETGLERTLRLMHAVSEAIKPLDYQLVVIDCGSTDATQLLFSSRSDISYARLASTPSAASVAKAVIAKVQGPQLIMLDQQAVLHEASLRHLHEGLKLNDCCRPAGAWLGAVAMRTSLLKARAAHMKEPYSLSAVAAAIPEGSFTQIPQSAVSREIRT